MRSASCWAGCLAGWVAALGPRRARASLESNDGSESTQVCMERKEETKQAEFSPLHSPSHQTRSFLGLRLTWVGLSQMTPLSVGFSLCAWAQRAPRVTSWDPSIVRRVAKGRRRVFIVDAHLSECDGGRVKDVHTLLEQQHVTGVVETLAADTNRDISMMSVRRQGRHKGTQGVSEAKLVILGGWTTMACSKEEGAKLLQAHRWNDLRAAWPGHVVVAWGEKTRRRRRRRRRWDSIRCRETPHTTRQLVSWERERNWQRVKWITREAKRSRGREADPEEDRRRAKNTSLDKVMEWAMQPTRSSQNQKMMVCVMSLPSREALKARWSHRTKKRE